MTTILQKYGMNLIKEHELDKKRILFEYDFELTMDNIKSFLENKLKMEIIDLKIVKKTFSENDSLNFHIDDCQLITNKNIPQYNKEKYIQIDKNKYLYFNNEMNKLPIYTAIFYSSTYDIDFTGGELILADNTKIKAKNKTGIILDSREVHKVTPIKSGVRNSCVVKIYN